MLHFETVDLQIIMYSRLFYLTIKLPMDFILSSNISAQQVSLIAGELVISSLGARCRSLACE